MSVAPRNLRGLFCACLVSSLIGCSTLHIPLLKERVPKASARNPVVQVLCLWQPAEGRDPDGMPCRGFAGQILFLANRGSLPVKVDGAVRIYLFDDQGTTEEQTKPLRQYDFDAKSWERHLTTSAVGPSYNVFVPYTRRGTHEANCALRVRLTPESGEAVFSELASIPLTGRKLIEKSAAEEVPTTEDAQAAATAVSQSLRRTTTIALNGDDARKSPHSESPATITPQSKKIQPVSHADVSPSNEPGAKRIEQLETLVQQLLEQQNSAKSGRVSQAHHTESTSVLRDESPAGSSRIRLTTREIPEALDDARPVRSANAEGRRVNEDEASAAPRRLQVGSLDSHPLNEFEDDEPAEPLRTAVRTPRRAVSNHPLVDFDDDLERGLSPEKNAVNSRSQRVVRARDESAPAPRVIRATEESHDDRSWSDPFEPIETGSIETTSIQDGSTPRQRLRAAR